MAVAKKGAALIAAALLPLVLVLSFRNMWAVYLIAVLPWLVVHFRSGGARLIELVTRTAPGRLLTICLLLATASLAWTSGKGGDEAIVELYVLVFVAGITLSAASMPREASGQGDVPRLLSIGTLIGLLLLAFEGATGSLIRQSLPPEQEPVRDMSDTGHGFALALILLPPAMLWLSGRTRLPWPFWATALIAGAGGVLSIMVVNALAFAAGLITMLCAAGRRRWPLGMAAALGVFAVLTPLFYLMFSPPPEVIVSLPILDSAAHRLLIGRTLMDLWQEGNMLFGEGVRSVYALTESAATVTLASGMEVKTVSSHAHNIFVQFLYEFGLVGYLLFVAGGAFVFRAIWKAKLSSRTETAIAGLLAITLVYALSHMDLYSIHVWCGIAFSTMSIMLQARSLP
ncbi:O-antigen ligase family protein [Parvularcula maris]|uniref:O-antigen ligase family protein n=1 Tax=Parvularcula maris TaxID=2965077 RepID=A0A9X2L6Y0_9PROT|nr:hypothetical protein [Parvularcula maris]MCQ8184279.1 hypothetical protein [Parvularcula maris]